MSADNFVTDIIPGVSADPLLDEAVEVVLKDLRAGEVYLHLPDADVPAAP